MCLHGRLADVVVVIELLSYLRFHCIKGLLYTCVFYCDLLLCSLRAFSAQHLATVHSSLRGPTICSGKYSFSKC